jgi:hypothetical protein
MPRHGQQVEKEDFTMKRQLLILPRIVCFYRRGLAWGCGCLGLNAIGTLFVQDVQR